MQSDQRLKPLADRLIFNYLTLIRLLIRFKLIRNSRKTTNLCHSVGASLPAGCATKSREESSDMLDLPSFY
jgi:hypothetical protein